MVLHSKQDVSPVIAERSWTKSGETGALTQRAGEELTIHPVNMDFNYGVDDDDDDQHKNDGDSDDDNDDDVDLNDDNDVITSHLS